MKECLICHCCFGDHMPRCDRDGAMLVDVLPGTPILAKRYRLDRKIGAGAMSVIFQGTVIENNETVMVKIVMPEVVAVDNTLPERFNELLGTVTGLAHKNVARVFDYGQSDQLLYLVMENVDGLTLAELLEQQGSLAVDEALTVISQVCEGVAAAHRRNLLHRDLKLSNIIVVKNEQDEELVKVCDFGLAELKTPELIESVSKARGEQLLGLPAYMAPEQFDGIAIDVRADVYSIGALLYHLLAGRPPFTGSSYAALKEQHISVTPRPLSELRPDVPIAIETMVMKALDKRLQQRPNSVLSLAVQLAAQLAEQEESKLDILSKPSVSYQTRGQATSNAPTPLQPPAQSPAQPLSSPPVQPALKEFRRAEPPTSTNQSPVKIGWEDEEDALFAPTEKHQRIKPEPVAETPPEKSANTSISVSSTTAPTSTKPSKMRTRKHAAVSPEERERSLDPSFNSTISRSYNDGPTVTLDATAPLNYLAAIQQSEQARSNQPVAENEARPAPKPPAPEPPVKRAEPRQTITTADSNTDLLPATMIVDSAPATIAPFDLSPAGIIYLFADQFVPAIGTNQRRRLMHSGFATERERLAALLLTAAIFSLRRRGAIDLVSGNSDSRKWQQALRPQRNEGFVVEALDLSIIPLDILEDKVLGALKQNNPTRFYNIFLYIAQTSVATSEGEAICEIVCDCIADELTVRRLLRAARRGPELSAGESAIQYELTAAGLDKLVPQADNVQRWLLSLQQQPNVDIAGKQHQPFAHILKYYTDLFRHNSRELES